MVPHDGAPTGADPAAGRLAGVRLHVSAGDGTPGPATTADTTADPTVTEGADR